jgi:hypothetical protein
MQRPDISRSRMASIMILFIYRWFRHQVCHLKWSIIVSWGPTSSVSTMRCGLRVFGSASHRSGVLFCYNSPSTSSRSLSHSFPNSSVANRSFFICSKRTSLIPNRMNPAITPRHRLQIPRFRRILRQSLPSTDSKLAVPASPVLSSPLLSIRSQTQSHRLQRLKPTQAFAFALRAVSTQRLHSHCRGHYKASILRALLNAATFYYPNPKKPE